MYERLKNAIENAADKVGFPEIDFTLEHPREISHGDWATNIALIIAKEVGKDSKVVASEIVDQLNKHKLDGISSISIAGAGFINFVLDRDIFVKELTSSQAERWGNTEVYKGKKILVEHSSPNLFKPFHIGHLMNNTIGEALYRLAKSSGAKAVPISFPSDISLGVAKAVFILLEKYGENFLPENVEALGDAYVEGTKRFEEDEDMQSRIKEVADNLYRGKDSPELTLFLKCKTFNIKYFEDTVAKLGSHFDSYIYESEAGIYGKKIVLENTPKIFTESEGAVVYIPEEDKKLHTAVFINSDGHPTYEAKDIGLLDLKFKRYDPDISITVTDNQQTSHFQVVVDAAGKIKPQWQTNSVHRSHGRMSFKGQKMSSRLGGVPLVTDVLSTIVEEVKAKNPDITEESAEVIGIASLKFAILKAQAGKNIDFDPETSLSFEGDSGPYLQYTAVRAGALLSKGSEAGIEPNNTNPVDGLPAQAWTETLERYTARFPEVVARAQREWAPHYLVTYLIELAQYFNSWYGSGKIIDDDKAATSYRLTIVSAVRSTIINGLDILGIQVPSAM